MKQEFLLQPELHLPLSRFAPCPGFGCFRLGLILCNPTQPLSQAQTGREGELGERPEIADCGRNIQTLFFQTSPSTDLDKKIIHCKIFTVPENFQSSALSQAASWIVQDATKTWEKFLNVGFCSKHPRLQAGGMNPPGFCWR